MRVETDRKIISRSATALDSAGVQYRLQVTVAPELMKAWNREISSGVPTQDFIDGCAAFFAASVANLCRSFKPEARVPIVDYMTQRFYQCISSIDLASMPGSNDPDVDGIPAPPADGAPI